jgi:hypothetical protein
MAIIHLDTIANITWKPTKNVRIPWFWWHPHERKSISRRWAVGVASILSDSRVWRRHPKPFSKHQAGKMRRNEREFVRSFDSVFLS